MIENPTLNHDSYSPRQATPPGPAETEVVQTGKESDSQPSQTTNETSKVVDVLQSMRASLATQAENSRLIADPQIRELLAARQSGKRVRIVDETEGDATSSSPLTSQRPTREDVSPPPDINTMTNPQLAEYMRKSILEENQRLIDARTKAQVDAIKAEMKPVLDALVAQRDEQLNREAASQLKEVQTKYPDFEQMRADMFELNKTTRGLNAEELYLLAKLRKGVPLTGQSTDTERPSENPSDRYGQTRIKKLTDTDVEELRGMNTTGRKGFGDALDFHLSRMGDDLGVPEPPPVQAVRSLSRQTRRR